MPIRRLTRSTAPDPPRLAETIQGRLIGLESMPVDPLGAPTTCNCLAMNLNQACQKSMVCSCGDHIGIGTLTIARAMAQRSDGSTVECGVGFKLSASLRALRAYCAQYSPNEWQLGIVCLMAGDKHVGACHRTMSFGRKWIVRVGVSYVQVWRDGPLCAWFRREVNATQSCLSEYHSWVALQCSGSSPPVAFTGDRG